ncbi:MAG TPA: chemotaxis protein CheW [Fibrobacteraceae bacterium]|nr:chemotaxis protein CheW [Fibrobacteraceae bacterium]
MESTDTTTATAVSDSYDILLFHIGESLCGINVLQIQEVRKDFEITPVPLAPDYVCGVLNLRGEIATVFDLALKLGNKREQSPNTGKVIVMKNQNGEYDGLLVDDIADVMQIRENEINKSPGHMSSIKAEYVKGLCRQDEDLVVLLDLNAIFALN